MATRDEFHKTNKLIMKKTNSPRPPGRQRNETQPPAMPSITSNGLTGQTRTLEITISNGDPRQDSRLRFDFSASKNHPAQVWIARLPKIKNADVFPRRLDPNRWELALEATANTQPMEVLAYPPADAERWLKTSRHRGPAHTELFILALDNQFTITLRDQPSK
jgi:hypothetical protein